MTRRRIFTTSVASVYPHDVAKAQKKGRTQAEVAEIILWLTGYTAEAFADCLAKKTDLETFFGEAPAMNPARAEVKGVICGVRVEEVKDPLMREIRYLDKLVEELAKGKAMGKILRGRALGAVSSKRVVPRISSTLGLHSGHANTIIFEWLFSK